MPATTYAISVNEETARRFEAAAASQNMEPSEVLCKLVRQFAESGGFDDAAAKEQAELDSLEQQASEWLTLRAAHERQRQEDARLRAESGEMEPEIRARKPLPWEDPVEDASDWEQGETTYGRKLPWGD